MIRECEEEVAPVYAVRMLVMLSMMMVMIMVMMVMMLVMMIRRPSSEQVSKKSSQFVLCHLVQPYSSRGILDGDGGIRW